MKSLKTKEKINIAYLEDIVEEFQKLMSFQSDNEKKRQDLFEKHSWIFSNLFHYEVILREREAYVGGKIIQGSTENSGWYEIHLVGWDWEEVNYRIAPRTLHQAAQESIKYDDEHTQYIDGYHAGAKFGANWQKEQEL